ncbi:MAG: hypothetical protein VKO39_06275 [Cyanobacteriota bacterium]|nr:hypothetical protein [Cyanobacteriota bacterium]
MTEPSLTVRQAQEADLPHLARYGLALGQLHVGFDGERFSTPPGGESAYAAFFRAEMQRPEVVLLIAELGPQPVGRQISMSGMGAAIQLYTKEISQCKSHVCKEVALRMGERGIGNLPLRLCIPAKQIPDFRECPEDLLKQIDGLVL